MYQLRTYQNKALQDALTYINSTLDKKVLMIQPVGSGKSLVIAAIANSIKEPIIILQPSKELLQQNLEKYKNYGNEASVYSASLSSRELGHVTFATIGSIKNEIEKVKQLGVKLIIVDECHQASKNESQLAKFIEQTGIKKVIGLTATPIELGTFKGQSFLKMINRSRKNLFQEIIHCTQVKEVVDGGYWTKMIYENKHVDTTNLRLNTTGSDYTEKSLEKYYEQNRLKDKILVEVEKLRAEGRKSILIFVPSITRAEQLVTIIPNSACVHSKTSNKERDAIIDAFKNLQVNVVINVGVLLTGFDHPLLDSIISARPTNSFVIHYQMLGRGVRPHKNKKDCKYVDYSGNFVKFGKLEDIKFVKGSFNWAMFLREKQLTAGSINKIEQENFNGIIWFGKYKGKNIRECDSGYLKWLIKEFRPRNKKERQMIVQAEQILL